MIKITFHKHVIPVPNLEAGTKITHPRTINASNPHAQKMLHVHQTLCKEIVHSTPESNRGKKQVGPQ
jgi:hypothetical protein